MIKIGNRSKINKKTPNVKIALTGLTVIFFLLFSNMMFAGTTGKLAGNIKDSKTGEPVVGANIIIKGTHFGAAADLDGYYYINNISPGEYTVIISAVGYQTTVVNKVLIQIDHTTNLDVSLNPQVINMKNEVVVTATRPLVQKDLTSTSATISSNDIKMMPVESVGQIVNLQAGVVNGHFRGGRSGEVAYLIDGVPVTDAFNGGSGVTVENSSIRQMEVISGTFNAEYGQAMSGIVNIVTQDGSQKFNVNVSGYIGNYFTPHTDIFRNLNHLDNIATQNIELTLSGPSPVPNLSYFLTGRYFHNRGYLYGQRIFNVTDDKPFVPDPSNPSFWIPIHTGDSAFVPMNPYDRYSLNGKLTYSLPKFKISYSLFYDFNKNKYYDHFFSWTPDGILNHYRTDFTHILQFSHFPSNNTLQTLKLTANMYYYRGSLYDNPYDPRYVNPLQGLPTSGYTFREGGNDGSRYRRHTFTFIGQWSLSTQLNKEHTIKVGLEGRYYEIMNHDNHLVNLTDGVVDTTSFFPRDVWTPGYPQLGSITSQGNNQMYNHHPFGASAYLQDKMEYDIMIINAGIRFDYFDANASFPANPRNMDNNPAFPGAFQYTKASPKFQVSPRLGASFPITDKGIIRFSYGHFFQIPNFQNLYTNPDFIVVQGAALSSVMGNPDLKPQKTVMYEIGLQQVLFPNVVLNLSVYYRDIRNLLGMEIINTYEGFKYGRFINRDYGNVRGFIVTFEKRFADYVGAKLDYTYQIAEGNASDPMSVYNNNRTNPPIEATKTVVPLDWDQRNTLNLSLNVGQPGDWTVGLVFQYGSGSPYTEDIRISQGVRFENGGRKPPTYNLDLRAEKTFKIGSIDVNTFLLVYNVLDIKNEYGVYSTTGRASVDLGPRLSNPGEIIGLNTLQQYINNPSMYSAPREIRLGFGFGF